MELMESTTEDLIRRTADIKVSDEFPFSKMLLSDKLLKSLEKLNLVKPSPIQLKVIPLARSRIDMILQAKSGTGKTLAFAICLLENYNNEMKFPQGLVVVPTREIAVQIVGVLNDLGKSFKNFKACGFIGGMDVANDRKNIQSSKIVVGTPGRILHLIQSEIFNTSCLKTFVLDEADKLFEGGQMEKDMKKIINHVSRNIQFIATTATVSTRLELFAKQQMKNPIGITPKHEIPVLLGIKQFIKILPRTDDNIELMNIKVDELVKIFNRITFKQCLLFTSSQSKTESYGNYLRKKGWKNEVINGAQDQSQRLEVLEKLMKFKCRILITTDLMARGIDIENINLIINLDIPYDGFTYLHRIGRAGRFGSHGIAITFSNGDEEMDKFQKILNDFGGDDVKILHFPRDDEKYDFWSFEEESTKIETKLEDFDKANQNAVNNLTLLDITRKLIDEPKQEIETFSCNDILDDYENILKTDTKDEKSKENSNSTDSGISDVFMKTIQDLNLYKNNEENNPTKQTDESHIKNDKAYRKVVFKTSEENDEYFMSDISEDGSCVESEMSSSESEDDDDIDDVDMNESGYPTSNNTHDSYHQYNSYVQSNYSMWQNIYNFQLANIQNYIQVNKK